MENPLFTVYFRNFPKEFADAELKEIFAECGPIHKFFIHRSRQYGMVEYSNIHACTKAIHVLNGTPPFHLYVNMARNQPVDRKETEETFNSTRNSNHNYSNMSNNRDNLDDLIYIEEDVYVDQNNKPVNILKDPTTGEIYVPLSCVTNIKHIVRKVPKYIGELDLSNGISPVGSEISQHSGPSSGRKIKYNNNTHDLNVECSFSNDNDTSSNDNSHFYQGQESAHFENRKFKPQNNNRRNDQQNSSSFSGDRTQRFNKKFQNNLIRDPEPIPGSSTHCKPREEASVGRGFQEFTEGKTRDEGRSGRGFNRPEASVEGRNRDRSFAGRGFVKNNSEETAFGGRNTAYNTNRFNQAGSASGTSGNAGNSEWRAKGNNVNKFNRGEPGHSGFSTTKTGDEGSSGKGFNKFIRKPQEKLAADPEENWGSAKAAAAPVNSHEVKSPPPGEKTVAEKPTREESATKSSVSDRLKRDSAPKAPYKRVELPRNEYTEVKVEEVENEEVGWVQISNKEEEFLKVMTDVVTAANSSTATQPEVGKLCLAKFEDVWFRAVVLTTAPKIKVRYIDYGNTSVVPVSELLEISLELAEIPAFAVCIKLANGAPCKIALQNTMKVKPVHVENDVIVVHVENGIYDRTEVKPVNKCLLSEIQKRLLSQMKEGITGFFGRTLILSKNKYIAYVLPLDVLSEDINLLQTINTEADSSFRPKVGEIVCAQNEAGWNRAYILEILQDGYKVAFIDYGEVSTVGEVRPLPENVALIPLFSLVCTANNNNLDKINDNVDFTITKMQGDTFIMSLNLNGKELAEVKATPWNPADSKQVPEVASNSPQSIPNDDPSTKIIPEMNLNLQNGERVILLDERDGYLFVRTKQGYEILSRINKYMRENKCTDMPLVEKPEVGLFVAARYEDAYYRAVVESIADNGSVSIFYIDYGNTEMKPFFSLKVLDETMCKEPWTIIKIRLQNFVNKSFGPKSLAHFKELAEMETYLKACFENVEDGVELIKTDGTLLSKELMKYEGVSRPGSSRSSHLHSTPKVEPTEELYKKIKPPGRNDPKIISLETMKIPLGRTEIKCMSELDLSTKLITVCANNSEVLHKIHVELQAQINKYVRDIAPNESYTPEIEEVILAENDGKWYRGLCIAKEEEDIQIFFIDYGFSITVPTTNIRRIPIEFTEQLALVNFAKVNGIPDSPSERLAERLENLLEKNNVYKVNVLNNVEDCYEIDFPDILNILKQENLI